MLRAQEFFKTIQSRSPQQPCMACLCEAEWSPQRTVTSSGDSMEETQVAQSWAIESHILGFPHSLAW